MIRLGLEVFLKSNVSLIEGKKVGLLTNQTGVDNELNSIIDLFYNNPRIKLTAIFAPEHGIRNEHQAGVGFQSYVDKRYNIPVFSLYRPSVKYLSLTSRNLDKRMRLGVSSVGKSPTPKMMEAIDVLVFDIQDVGTRVYTHIWTMALCMRICAKKGVPFIVLDRPNPINGVTMEGFVLKYPKNSSFIGLYPILLRHGMTVGELARFFNGEFLDDKVDSKAIPMEGWKREMWYSNTSLPWIMPSPNIPTLASTTVYLGQVLFEGTNVSEGRGTTKPFEITGAPWIDGFKLSRKINAYKFPGVKCREVCFVPSFSKYKGRLCSGVQIHVTDKSKYKPFEFALNLIKTIMEMYPDRFSFYENYFDMVVGNSKVREMLLKNIEVDEILQSSQEDLVKFSELRREYLLYS